MYNKLLVLSLMLMGNFAVANPLDNSYFLTKAQDNFVKSYSYFSTGIDFVERDEKQAKIYFLRSYSELNMATSYLLQSSDIDDDAKQTISIISSLQEYVYFLTKSPSSNINVLSAESSFKKGLSAFNALLTTTICSN